MKKTYILPILIALLFSNCEKVVDIDVPSRAAKLIIDAAFEVYFDESPITAISVVKLRLSADYFDVEIPIVTDATVFLTNLSDNSVINFLDADLDGNYEPSGSFIPSDSIQYQLTVGYDNETYVGTASKIKSSPIANIVQGDDTLFSGNETEIEIDFTDNGSQQNYSLFNFTNNFFLTIEDRFYNGSDYNFSYYYAEEDIELPTTLTIKMSGISKEYFTYFRILIDQSGTNGGGPFQSVPSSLLGNMINTTNEDNFPLGYFHISETDTFAIDLVERD
jgi:hypothetical protein